MTTLQQALLVSIDKNKNKNALWVNNKYYTYKKLDEISNRYSEIYSKNNSNFVCILSEKNIYCYASILSVVKDGRTYVPLNPKFPVEKNKQIFNSSGAKILVVESKFINQAKFIVNSKSRKKVLIIVPDKKLPAFKNKISNCEIYSKKDFHLSNKKKFTFRKTNPLTICYILFTSGSTGLPKGVPINNSNLMSYLKNVYAKYKPNFRDKFSHNFDLTFDLSIHDIFLSWISGACLYVTPDDQLLNPGYFIKKHNITMWFSVPSLGINMYKMKQLKKNIFPSIRQTLFCGEALPSTLVEKWSEAAPNSKIDNLYGPTETTIAITSYCWKKDQSSKECFNGIVPIGIPFKGQKTYLSEPKNFKTKFKKIKELCFSGPQVFKGYLKNKKMNIEKFLRKKDKTLWYKTGDLVEKNLNGNFIYLGRLDRQIKVKGFRVEIQEVENLIKKVTKSNYSAVIGWPLVDESKYSYSGMIVFILKQIKIKDELIIKRLGKKLPFYSIPQKIIRLKKFPINFNGKIDYKKLSSLTGYEN